MLRARFLPCPMPRLFKFVCATMALLPMFCGCAKQKPPRSSTSEWRLVRPAQPTVESFTVAEQVSEESAEASQPSTPDPLVGDGVADLSRAPNQDRSAASRTRRVAAGLVESLRADWHHIESCVQAAGHPMTRADAVVTLRFSLHADGELADDRKIEASGWPAAALCIRDTLKRLPLPELDAAVDVVYRMDFEDTDRTVQ